MTHEHDTPLIASCPLDCEGTLAPTDIVLPESPLMRCAHCGQLVSRASAARYEQSMAEFDDPRGTLPDAASAPRRDEISLRRLKLIETMIGKPREKIRLLDVGCSSGAFLRAARAAGFAAEGVEPALQAARTARAAGLAVFRGTLAEAAYPPRSFDAVTMFEVIEHLADPLAVVGECRRVLQPRGLLVIGTGNTASWTARAMKARWEYFHIDRHGGHVSFYHPASIRVLAQKTGFGVARIATRSVRFAEKGGLPAPLYAMLKFSSGLLNLPAQLSGRGHDMLIVLRKTAGR